MSLNLCLEYGVCHWSQLVRSEVGYGKLLHQDPYRSLPAELEGPAQTGAVTPERVWQQGGKGALPCSPMCSRQPDAFGIGCALSELWCVPDEM